MGDWRRSDALTREAELCIDQSMPKYEMLAIALFGTDRATTLSFTLGCTTAICTEKVCTPVQNEIAVHYDYQRHCLSTKISLRIGITCIAQPQITKGTQLERLTGRVSGSPTRRNDLRA
jgi:hypothetical protein